MTHLSRPVIAGILLVLSLSKITPAAADRGAYTVRNLVSDVLGGPSTPTRIW